MALLGLSGVEARCKKKCGPCKRCKKGKCKPKPAGTVCTGGTCQSGTCVPATAPSPLVCSSGTFVVAGRCAPSCGTTCEAKTGICGQTIDGFLYCAARIQSCAAIPRDCRSHADCAAQEVCALAACGPADSLVNRCVPFLN